MNAMERRRKSVLRAPGDNSIAVLWAIGRTAERRMMPLEEFQDQITGSGVTIGVTVSSKVPQSYKAVTPMYEGLKFAA